MADEATTTTGTQTSGAETATTTATQTSGQGAAEQGTTGAQGSAGGQQEAQGAPNWQERFEAQQKVNADLERKLKRSDDNRAEVEELREKVAKAEGREAEYQAAQASAKVEADALAKANERILKAEIRAAAAGKLADPADALRYLNLADFEVGADGEVDTSAITGALEALTKSKPYLAAQGGTTGTVFQSPTSSREGDAGKKQVTRDELKGMTPEQINAARADGRLNDLLGIKN